MSEDQNNFNKTDEMLTRNWDAQANNLDALEKNKDELESQRAELETKPDVQEQINSLNVKIDRITGFIEQTMSLMQKILDKIDKIQKPEAENTQEVPSSQEQPIEDLGGEDVGIKENERQTQKFYDMRGEIWDSEEEARKADEGWRDAMS